MPFLVWQSDGCTQSYGVFADGPLYEEFYMKITDFAHPCAERPISNQASITKFGWKSHYGLL